MSSASPPTEAESPFRDLTDSEVAAFPLWRKVAFFIQPFNAHGLTLFDDVEGWARFAAFAMESEPAEMIKRHALLKRFIESCSPSGARVESGWLIEQKAVGPIPASWFTGDGFSTDSLEAIRFARRDDAQKLLDRMLKRKVASAEAWELFRVRLGADNFAVTEHQWGFSGEPGATQWISVKDRLPEIRKEVLCWHAGNYRYGGTPVMVMWLHEDGKWRDDDQDDGGPLLSSDHVSHWQPMLAGPSSTKVDKP